MDSRTSHTFSQLPSLLWREVAPEPLTNAQLAAIVPDLQASFAAPVADLSAKELCAWLNGTARIAQDQRVATCYAGHQFGVWAGQLGDGRALSLGEFALKSGSNLEIQVKGLGRTPFSRMGDGRAVIRSSVREFLCAEYMYGLGIPSTRSLALLVSDTPVRRETLERAAIVARVFPGQVRFGHFEFLYHFGHHAELKTLIEYVRAELMPGSESISAWFSDVVMRTAELIAHWQAAGFCHGVMNTDNMSILGLTLDYGPFGFMQQFNPAFICNHSDQEGRYSYENQARAGLWNLQCLASCLLPFMSESDLTNGLDKYEGKLAQSYSVLMARKLGISSNEQTLPLVAMALQALEKDNIDYHFFFAALSSYESQRVDSLAGFFAEYPNAPHVRKFLQSYDSALQSSAAAGNTGDRIKHMHAANPRIVLHNHLAQRIIAQVERDEFSELRRLLAALQNPFAENTEFKADLKPYRGVEVELSCSS